MPSEVLPGTDPINLNVVNIQYWHNVTSSTLDGTEASVRGKGSKFSLFIALVSGYYLIQFVLVYYRAYHNNRAVATKRPAYLNDIYLGRIKSKWVSPPHTAGSLKLCLSSMETIHPTKTRLFASVSNQSALADDTPISLKSNQTLGVIPEDPVILSSETMPEAGMQAGTESLRVAPDSESPLAPRFLFYGVYSEAGVRASRAPIDAEEPWVSNIDLDSILPPVSVSSLLHVLDEKEGINFNFTSQLFAQDGLTPLGDNQIFMEDGNWLGASAEEHLVIRFARRSPPFAEGSLYRIQNCSTGNFLTCWSELQVRLCPPRNSYRSYQNVTFKLRHDGAVAIHLSAYWMGPDGQFVHWSAMEHYFTLIPSKTYENRFFIYEDDPVSPKAFHDPGGNGSHLLALSDLDVTDTSQMWNVNLVPPLSNCIDIFLELFCFCC